MSFLQQFLWLFTVLLIVHFQTSLTSSQDQLQCWLDSNGRNCSWSNSEKWAWEKPIFNGFQIDGPPTLPNENMHALVANLSANNSGYSMTSLKLPWASVSCFSFDYYILVDSTKSTGLKLYLETEKNQKIASEEIWSMSGVSDDFWKRAHVNVNPQSSFQVIYFAKLSGITNLFYFFVNSLTLLPLVQADILGCQILPLPTMCSVHHLRFFATLKPRALVDG